MPGGLEKAKIIVDSGSSKGKEIPFMYNPASITWSKKVNWNDAARPRKDTPNQDYGGGQAQTFSISEAVFDTTLPVPSTGPNPSRQGVGSGVNVKAAYIDKLFKLLEIEKHTYKSGDRYHPPRCVFQWGRFRSFPVYITNLDVTYELFSPQGVPLRARVNIRFKEADTEAEQNKPQNPTSVSYARKMWTVLDGETLDWIAYREYGDPSAWRHIAETNNVDDPLNLRAGQVLKLTPLDQA